jgi:hypothetical protein
MADEDDSRIELLEEDQEVRANQKVWLHLHRRLMQHDDDSFDDADHQVLWYVTAILINAMGKEEKRKGNSDSLNKSNILLFTAYGILQCLHDRPPQPLASQEDIGNGQRSNNRLTPAQSSAVKIVAAYYRLIKEGIFSDPRPNESVRECFGKGEDAVRSWARRDPGILYDLLRDAVLRVSASPEELNQTRRETAKVYLKIAGRMYKKKKL